MRLSFITEICLDKPMKKKMTEAEAEKFTKDLSKYVLVGKYKEGLPLVKKAMKQYPDDLVCQYQYAKLLGDWADELPPVRRKKLKTEAAGILASLLPRLRGQPAVRRFGICLNYYYQSYAFKDMYSFGKRFASTDRQKGYYAQAMGAGLYAEELHQAGKESQQKQWAAKSAKAWEKYDLKSEKYYFAHYSYAKALALNAELDKALKVLKTAARLSGRPITDWEFKDVLGMIESASSN